MENTNLIQKQMLDFNPATKEEIGNLSSLTTTTKQDLVSALNEQVSSYKTNKATTDAQILAINSGSPKGVYPTLAALQTAFPTGASGTYIVSADGKWYYWSGSSWVSGGMYLNTPKVPTIYDFNSQLGGVLNLFRTTDITFTTGTALKTDGTTTTSGAFNASSVMVSNLIDLVGFTHVNALIMRNFGLAVAPIAFYDSLGTFLSIYTNGNNPTSSTFIKVPIPVNASKMCFAYYTDAQSATQSAPVFTSLYLSNDNSVVSKQMTIRTDLDVANTNINTIKASSDMLSQSVTGLVTVNRSSITLTVGQSLLPDGTTSTSGAYNASLLFVTDYISLIGFSQVNALIYKTGGNGSCNIVFYNASDVVTGYYSSNNTFSPSLQSVPIPVGTTKMRYCYSTDARADSLSQPRFSYLELVNMNSLSQKQALLSADVEQLKTGTAGLDSVRIQSRNLFDKLKVTNSGFQIGSDGNITADATKCVTDYIPVSNGDTFYFISGTVESVVFYDSNKVRLGGTAWQMATNATPVTITTANVAFMRTNVKLVNLDTFAISKSPLGRYEKPKLIEYNNIQGFNNGAINWWDGKIGTSLGDSLTGQGYFQKYLQRYFNLYKFANRGIGGTKLSGPANGSGDSMWMDSRINALDIDADFLTVLGGQNDGPSAVMGTVAMTNVDTNTISGALNVLISKVLYKYQKLSAGYYAGSGISYVGVTQVTTAKSIKIFLCTPFYVPSEEANGFGPIRQQIAETIRGIAKLWGLPVMDLAARSFSNASVADVYWGTDRTHPIEAFYSDLIAPVMIGEMERFKPVDYSKAYYI